MRGWSPAPVNAGHVCNCLIRTFRYQLCMCLMCTYVGSTAFELVVRKDIACMAAEIIDTIDYVTGIGNYVIMRHMIVTANSEVGRMYSLWE